MLNVLYKMASAAIANRLKLTLDNLIHVHQKGFISRRFIGENIRLIYIEDIYFFEVNTKYISSIAVKKSVFLGVRSTSENADIFTARDEIYLVFADKKVNFLFISYSTELQKSKPNFLLGCFSFDLTFAVCLLGITLDVNIVCT